MLNVTGSPGSALYGRYQLTRSPSLLLWSPGFDNTTEGSVRPSRASSRGINRFCRPWRDPVRRWLVGKPKRCFSQVSHEGERRMMVYLCSDRETKALPKTTGVRRVSVSNRVGRQEKVARRVG